MVLHNGLGTDCQSETCYPHHDRHQELSAVSQASFDLQQRHLGVWEACSSSLLFLFSKLKSSSGLRLVFYHRPYLMDSVSLSAAQTEISALHSVQGATTANSRELLSAWKVPRRTPQTPHSAGSIKDFTADSCSPVAIMASCSSCP